MDTFLKLENIEYSHGDLSSLQDISFSLKKGENLVFFGLEDSGIDLLGSIIINIEHSFSGNVIFKNRIINSLNTIELHIIRRELVYLQKIHGLIGNMTVEENISLPLDYHTQKSEEEIKFIAKKLMEELNLTKCSHLKPVDLRDSQSLSAAFARSVILDPDILILEHPLENQSIMNVLPFMNSLKKRCESEDKSVILTAYKPKYFLDYSDRFIMLHKGKIVFDGTVEEMKSELNPYVKQFLRNSLEGPMKIN